MVAQNRGRALNASVLALNRNFTAVRVITARHALILLFRDVAEVIDIEEGQFNNYDFPSWCELSRLRVEQKDTHDDWIRAVNFEMKLVYPSGDEKLVLSVPNYRFDWQVGYELAEPIDLPKGTKVMTVAHYDNSRANKFNPDPTVNVKYGAQSWDEMHVAFVGILIDAKTNPARTFGTGRRPAAAPQTRAQAQD